LLASAKAGQQARLAGDSGFFHDRRRRPEQRLGARPTNDEDGKALLAWCEEKTGVATPFA
jgi:hypothetical protein